MDVLLFFIASITSGVWCAYLVEYVEDKQARRQRDEGTRVNQNE
ncbi:hypothetical protein HNQ92_004132 [Rhabdobacter roseus]|uniref:Uncharacterized protein n=1 Tax=Rhabdobacter roseus TaxID=1655419 RepID=A0A840TWK7_9BACT|nr:hypothetical protein [Rhabdobacter roseus]MBB5285972.1 hypothetical protein [Rhabdobacter roseus]